MRFVDTHIRLSGDEYDPARALSRGLGEVIRRMPSTNLLTWNDGPVSFGGPFMGKMTTPSFILLAAACMQAIVQLKWKKETEVADQIFQSFTNFFEVRGVRDKRHEERKIGV